LVFPVLRVTDAGLRFDVVEPGVFHARPARPYVLAGDAAGVTADAFVEVQYHADLCAYFHDLAPWDRRSIRGSRPGTGRRERTRRRVGCPASRRLSSCGLRRIRRGWCR